MAGASRRDSESSAGSDREESKIALTKRRKTDTAFVATFKQDLSTDDDDSENSDDESVASKDDPDPDTTADATEEVVIPHAGRRPAIKALTKEELEAVNAARARSGVVYLSKVPPFMKPQKVKHLLSAYGETNRIFLAPEDAKSYAKRVRFGGNKRKMFTEGWIEFTDKRKAKLVAETLNTCKIGGKKSSFYHDDLWNLKYLPKFKWDDLTAQIAAENASRQTRLANEIEQGKKEARHYLKTAERAKMISKIQASRAAKDVSDRGASRKTQQSGETEKMRRVFVQRQFKDTTKPIAAASQSGAGDATSAAAQTKMKEVMSSIFG